MKKVKTSNIVQYSVTMKKQEIENNQIEIPSVEDQMDDVTIWQRSEENSAEINVRCLLCSKLLTVKNENTKKRNESIMKQRKRSHASTPKHLDLLRIKLQKKTSS